MRRSPGVVSYNKAAGNDRSEACSGGDQGNDAGHPGLETRGIFSNPFHHRLLQSVIGATLTVMIS